MDNIITQEGGYVNDKLDKGGETIWGISKKHNPDAWKNGPPSEEEARAIYLQKYVVGPGFHLIPPSHRMTQAQLIDFFVLSGYQATKNLQEILGVEADGMFGQQTLKALTGTDDKSLNNLLMIARAKMIGRIVKRDPSQVKFISGWLDRVFSFFR